MDTISFDRIGGVQLHVAAMDAEAICVSLRIPTACDVLAVATGSPSRCRVERTGGRRYVLRVGAAVFQLHSIVEANQVRDLIATAHLPQQVAA